MMKKTVGSGAALLALLLLADPVYAQTGVAGELKRTTVDATIEGSTIYTKAYMQSIAADAALGVYVARADAEPFFGWDAAGTRIGLGPGGASAIDTWITRIAADALGFDAPAADPGAGALSNGQWTLWFDDVADEAELRGKTPAGDSISVTLGAGGAGGLANIVEDLTPQLGGDLDLNGSVITGLVIGANIQGWDNDLDDLAALVPTKGNLLAGNGADWLALAVGLTDGHVLTIDSAEAAGVKWAAGGGASISAGDSNAAVTDAGAGQFDVTLDGAVTATFDGVGLTLGSGDRVNAPAGFYVTTSARISQSGNALRLYGDNALGLEVGNGSNLFSNYEVKVNNGLNLNVGTSTTATDGTNAVHIVNGTVPSTSRTNGVILYAEDVSASSELRARDEAGNVTTLSPHNFSLYQPALSQLLPWSFYSSNSYLGLEINVDMYGAIRALEQLTGKTLIRLKCSDARRSWDADQTAKVVAAQDRRAEWQARKTDSLASGEEFGEVSPDLYTAKPMPAWMADRLATIDTRCGR